MPLVRGMSGDITSVDDMEIRRPDGDNILVQVFGSPIVDVAGQIMASIAIFQDITERKQTEEALRASQTQLSEALNIARLAYWEFDVGTQMFTFNDQIYALYGTTAEQEGGYQMSAEQFVRRFVHPEGAENAGLQIQRAIETPDPNYTAQFEDRIIRGDGKEMYITVQLRILKDQDGRTIKLYGTNQDITDRKQTEFLLNERVKELNCLNDIGREMEESPPVPKLLQWVTERVPPAMQYPDLCLVAIDFDGRVYGEAEAIELESQMTHGLYISGEIAGRVYIAYTEKRDFLNEESALLGGIATRLGGYIENRRLFDQMQRRAEREQLVNTISQRIQSKMTMETALQTAVEELGRAFQARYTRVKLNPPPKTDGNGKLSNGTKEAE
jgi:PAS domain S-box-containing protein